MKALTKDVVYNGYTIRQNGDGFLVFFKGQIFAVARTLDAAFRAVDERD